MSLVIGYIAKDKETGKDVMYMAADSCGYGNLTKQEYKNRKLMVAKGNVFVGVIGSYKTHNLVSANLRNFDNIRTVRRDILGKVIPMLADELDSETMDESSIMVMFKNRLLYIQGDFSVLEPAGDKLGERQTIHKTIGAHSISADLVMDTLVSELPDITAEALLLKTLGILSNRCDAIGAPFYIVNSKDGRVRKYATAESAGVPVRGGW